MVSEAQIGSKFKKTDIGSIPEDWNLKPVIEFADVTSGGTPSTNKTEYWDGDIAWMNSGELNLKRVYEVEGRITELGLNNSATKLIPKYCVLIGLAGQGKTRGTVAMNYIPLCTNQSIAAIHPNKEALSEYLYQNLENRYKELRTLSTGDGGRGGLNLTLIKNLLIPLPPNKEEQTAIAIALNDTDKLISQLEKLIVKKQMIKQGAVGELLTGKKRLNGFKDSWIKKPFSEVSWFQEGPGLRNWQFTNSGMKVINVTNLEDGFLYLESTDRHISYELFNKMYRHFAIDVNDIVVASSGNSYAKVAVVRKRDLPLVMNTSVIRFKPMKGLQYEFLLAFLKSNLFKDQIDLLITGGAQPNFGPYHLNKIFIELPPTLEEQSVIGNILMDIDSELLTLKTKLEKYKQLKQGMMQNLLTGKIRLV